MRLFKRIVADLRGPNLPNNAAEMTVNEELVNLQTKSDGSRNNVQILDVKEIVKDSGILVFGVFYDDKDMDGIVKQKEKTKVEKPVEEDEKL
jgi:hypothetical protein